MLAAASISVLPSGCGPVSRAGEEIYRFNAWAREIAPRAPWASVLGPYESAASDGTVYEAYAPFDPQLVVGVAPTTSGSKPLWEEM